jgi:hypothetical protein
MGSLLRHARSTRRPLWSTADRSLRQREWSGVGSIPPWATMRAIGALLLALVVATGALAGCASEYSTCPSSKQVYAGLSRASELAVGPGQYRDGLTRCSPVTGDRYIDIDPRRVGLYSKAEIEQRLLDHGWSNGSTGWTHPDIPPRIRLGAFTEVIEISWSESRDQRATMAVLTRSGPSFERTDSVEPILDWFRSSGSVGNFVCPA